jgi:hypothetical protein
VKNDFKERRNLVRAVQDHVSINLKHVYLNSQLCVNIY